MSPPAIRFPIAAIIPGGSGSAPVRRGQTPSPTSPRWIGVGWTRVGHPGYKRPRWFPTPLPGRSKGGASKSEASCRASASARGCTGWPARTASAAGSATTPAASPSKRSAPRRPSTPSFRRCRPLPRRLADRRLQLPCDRGAAGFRLPHRLVGTVCRPARSIPADLATCPDCLREISDPADRRYRYPFTNCTNCGPRFTIAIDIPYDRPHTTMAPFRMCPACESEYSSPSDRRFHAQPNACPACGPRLWLAGPDGRDLASPDPIAAAAEAIGRGLIVAVKGLGGFHLACDATSAAAVAGLRVRKRRDERPFAVMTADLARAEDIAELDADERHLLLSVERPIVLARRRASAALAPTWRPAFRWSASCCRTRRCITCCWPPPGARWS